jgi:hypothetical protein
LYIRLWSHLWTLESIAGSHDNTFKQALPGESNWSAAKHNIFGCEIVICLVKHRAEQRRYHNPPSITHSFHSSNSVFRAFDLQLAEI